MNLTLISFYFVDFHLEQNRNGAQRRWYVLIICLYIVFCFVFLLLLYLTLNCTNIEFLLSHVWLKEGSKHRNIPSGPSLFLLAGSGPSHLYDPLNHRRRCCWVPLSERSFSLLLSHWFIIRQTWIVWRRGERGSIDPPHYPPEWMGDFVWSVIRFLTGAVRRRAAEVTDELQRSTLKDQWQAEKAGCFQCCLGS